MSENNQFKVAFTGHRHLKYVDVEQSLIKLHSDFPGIDALKHEGNILTIKVDISKEFGQP